jgi:hypothetical protein
MAALLVLYRRECRHVAFRMLARTDAMLVLISLAMFLKGAC